MALLGCSVLLGISQAIDVDAAGHCGTVDYQYILASGPAKGDWLLRWEYFRSPPKEDYTYTRAHVHVNAQIDGVDGAPRLHVPTARMPLELVLWHAIAEWGAVPKSTEWRAILEQSLDGFEERRTAS
jgi:hypothetical protein